MEGIGIGGFGGAAAEAIAGFAAGDDAAGSPATASTESPGWAAVTGVPQEPYCAQRTVLSWYLKRCRAVCRRAMRRTLRGAACEAMAADPRRDPAGRLAPGQSVQKEKAGYAGECSSVVVAAVAARMLGTNWQVLCQ